MNQSAPTPNDREVENVLYQKRQKVYPREVHGLFARLRVAGVLVLLGLYYFVPWLTYDGHQAVLFDLPARKFHIFGLVFWPQDFFYLAMLLVIAALSLFFFTALAGRLWCGYACPQTVWTEVFLWMERKIEGDRPRQMKLDKSPLNFRKFRIKATKHAAWIAFAAWTGFTFVGFFTPIRELGASLMNFSLGPWETFWILFYSFATYGNAGWLREQVCIYMCPYARFQSAMFDKDTLIISYDESRGEPRGSRKRSEDRAGKGLGDCIDCTMCVQVCPTGIDIRNGLQYQCIGCAACIDACNDVMDKMDYPRGLIRYTTENRLEGRPTHVLRPRTLVYGFILLALLAGLIYAIANRVPVDLNIIRDRNALYRETPMGLVENIYTLKLINMDEHAHSYQLTIEGLEQAELVYREDALKVPAGAVAELLVQVRIDPVHLDRPSNEIFFVLESLENPDIRIRQSGRFLGP
ncbi:polyferredoxin [Thiohalobacter thiocyanaticus]|uniref:Polyferredoxin n=1 Tax=Thiohalobacter thiocyanaticus TaxID=585455 RepID=A0A1Z4VMS1_9GAMM|nr:cytochrome c oxidase accessory protein CcoG [Thiohalobacter thiocyanaticus]BAZ92795.1 polyferredoxin [Thiohalobacter thiocyanaticus]